MQDLVQSFGDQSGKFKITLVEHESDGKDKNNQTMTERFSNEVHICCRAPSPSVAWASLETLALYAAKCLQSYHVSLSLFVLPYGG